MEQPEFMAKAVQSHLVFFFYKKIIIHMHFSIVMRFFAFLRLFRRYITL